MTRHWRRSRPVSAVLIATVTSGAVIVPVAWLFGTWPSRGAVIGVAAGGFPALLVARRGALGEDLLRAAVAATAIRSIIVVAAALSILAIRPRPPGTFVIGLAVAYLLTQLVVTASMSRALPRGRLTADTRTSGLLALWRRRIDKRVSDRN